MASFAHPVDIVKPSARDASAGSQPITRRQPAEAVGLLLVVLLVLLCLALTVGPPVGIGP